jgi:hypothetical protein
MKFHKSWTRITGTLRVYQYTCLIMSNSLLLRMRNVSDESSRQNKAHILCSIKLLSKVVQFVTWRGKIMHSRTGHRRQYNTAHMHFMLHTYGYRHTLRLCIISLFYTATMVARTPLNITFHVHFLPSFLFGIKRLALIVDTNCVLCKLGNNLYILWLEYSALLLFLEL